MQQTNKKQHLAGLVMLSLTAIFWGAGFVLNDNLLNAAFFATPNLINTLRFGVSAILLGAIFARKLRFNKKIILYAGIGGILLFGGFTLQLIGLKYTTPSHNGFFTASYIIFVPFISWILLKKRPCWQMFAGVGVAIVGLLILNLYGIIKDGTSNTAVGDLLTLAGAVLFAAQIALTDYAYSKKAVDYPNMTFWQILTGAVLFALYTLIFESKHYSSITFDASYCVWRLLIVILCGTAFAYLAQSYAQKHLSSTETSLVLACESPIGALISIIAGVETFVWTTVVGGMMVIAAVLIIEFIPRLSARRKLNEPSVDTPVSTAALDKEENNEEHINPPS